MRRVLPRSKRPHDPAHLLTTHFEWSIEGLLVEEALAHLLLYPVIVKVFFLGGWYVEVLIAPAFSEEAKTALAAKPNVRALCVSHIDPKAFSQHNFKRIGGGLLVQDQDMGRVSAQELKVVTRRAPSADELQDLLFAWTVAKFVKSNAIVYAANRRTIGVGAGQMSRVYSAKIAGIKAADEKLTVAGSVMASDAFFPFRDGIDAAAQAGIRAVIQPGGSQRDEEVIQAADEHDIAMVFTGMRHFRH